MIIRSKLEHLIASGVIASIVIMSWGIPSFAQVSSIEEIAKRWEEIASLRYQAAIGHESKAEQNESGGSDNRGEALKGAGDAKVSAAGNYKVASEYWKKAAVEYGVAGDLDNEKKARYNSDLAWEAARRTLREASEFHMRAAKHYEDANNLGEKVNALEKVASDLETLMQME